MTQGTLLELSLTSRPICHGLTKRPGLGIRLIQGENMPKNAYKVPARQAGGAGRAVCLCCGLFWLSGTEIGSRRPNNRDPRDPRTGINGASTPVALRRPGGPKTLRHRSQSRAIKPQAHAPLRCSGFGGLGHSPFRAAVPGGTRHHKATRLRTATGVFFL